jgi:hypothetical protein
VDNLDISVFNDLLLNAITKNKAELDNYIDTLTTSERPNIY